MSQAGIEFLKRLEGVRLKAYQDSVGVATIGVGHVLGVKLGDVITMEECEQFLKQDLKTAEDAVNNYIGAPINQNQFDALCSFTFNVGAKALATSTLKRKLNSHDYTGASNELLRWVHGNGRILKGLVKRRASEKALFDAPPA